MESKPGNDFELLLQSLDRMIEANDVKNFDACLRHNDSRKILGNNLAYFAHWASDRIASQYPSLSDPVVSCLLEYLMSTPEKFDLDETFIVFTGLAHSLQGQKTFYLWLLMITRCLSKFEYLRFKRVLPIFEDITASLSSISARCTKSDFKLLYRTMNASIDFYLSVVGKFGLETFMKDLSTSEILTLRKHVLFLFAQPLSVMSFNSETCSVYSRVYHLLNVVSEGLYTAYSGVVDGLRVCHSDHDAQLYLTVPAWFRILTYILLEAEPSDLKNSWPSVLSPGNYINLFHEFIILLLDGAHEENFLKTSLTDIPSLTKEIYVRIQSSAIRMLSRLCGISQPLNVSWWCPQRMLYLNLLKAISTQSVSTEEMPEIISDAIHCITKLITSSSYSAQCRIFYELLPPRVNEHHGFRGYLITLCKDSLHNCWVSVQKSGVEEAIRSEKLIGESSPQLPIQRSVLTGFCEMIFFYPNTWCSDALVDQSSWLLAAVNMALYIILRCDAINGAEGNSTVAVGVILALLRSSDDSSRFVTHFLNPLLSDLNTECNHLEAAASSLVRDAKMVAEQQQKKQLETALAAKEATLLRLRLLKTTTQHVFDCYNKLRATK